MRKVLSFVVVAAMSTLVGCTGEVVDEPFEDIDESLSVDLETEALIDPAEQDAIAGWCDFQNTWNSSWTTLENSVLTLVNQRRAAGATCGGVAKPPVPALTSNAKLRCAARFHSRDMANKNFFSHTGSNGSTFVNRIDNAGYVWTAAGENIAAGQTTAANVVNGWMASTGHCNNIMNGNFKNLGVGYSYNAAATYDHYWTQDFGKP
jgi:uncharacterized protein YkwD